MARRLGGSRLPRYTGRREGAFSSSRFSSALASITRFTAALIAVRVVAASPAPARPCCSVPRPVFPIGHAANVATGTREPKMASVQPKRQSKPAVASRSPVVAPRRAMALPATNPPPVRPEIARPGASCADLGANLDPARRGAPARPPVSPRQLNVARPRAGGARRMNARQQLAKRVARAPRAVRVRCGNEGWPGAEAAPAGLAAPDAWSVVLRQRVCCRAGSRPSRRSAGLVRLFRPAPSYRVS